MEVAVMVSHNGQKRLLSINIPSELETQRILIIQGFEKAFTARGGEAGILAKPDFPSFKFILKK
jgi:hypothetical protein